MTEPEPILLLGTGRCGSTFLQMALNRVGPIWIWGEHDGMLRSLMAWSRTTRESEPLRQFSYPHVGKNPLEVAEKSGTHAAWLCPFTPEDISRIERQAIVELFSQHLPPGKSRWGFKEIRYGAGSHVPERMFELFPKARLIHVVRNPADAIGSSVRAWHKDVFESAASTDELAERIRSHLAAEAERWVKVSAYLEALTAARPESTTTVQIERIADEFPRLLDFLAISRQSIPPPGTSDINKAPVSPQVNGMIAEQYSDVVKDIPELSRLAHAFGYST